MIKLVLFDVDGVLTDGRIWMDRVGESVKAFHVHDGLAVALLRAHGIRSGVLSGRSSAALDARIKELGFDIAVTGTLAKVDALAEITVDLGISAKEVAFVGDDVVDLPLSAVVGQFYAPNDAHPLILAVADPVLPLPGGHGVARLAAEHVLTARGLSLEAMYKPLLAAMTRSHVVQ